MLEESGLEFGDLGVPYLNDLETLGAVIALGVSLPELQQIWFQALALGAATKLPSSSRAKTRRLDADQKGAWARATLADLMSDRGLISIVTRRICAGEKLANSYGYRAECDYYNYKTNTISRDTNRTSGYVLAGNGNALRTFVDSICMVFEKSKKKAA